MEIQREYIRQHVSSASNLLSASFAVPDSNSSSLDSVLSAEGACVSGMLCDFHLLYLFSERGTITDTVFTGGSDLLCSFCHYNCREKSLAHLFPPFRVSLYFLFYLLDLDSKIIMFLQSFSCREFFELKI